MMNEKSYFTTLSMCFDRLYSKLNGMQRKAVTSVNGPLLVLAGAGSGKTTVLVNRIYHIMNYGNACGCNILPSNADVIFAEMQQALNGSRQELEKVLCKAAVNPAKAYNILCITFTNKAAGEFKERLSKMLGEEANDIWAGTFHSICVRILRRHIDKIGFSNSFTIYDTDDTKKVIAKLLKDNHIDDRVLSAKTVAAAVSSFKEQRIMPREAKDNAFTLQEKNIAFIYELYEQELKNASALDFDDLILKTIMLFEACPEVLDKYAEQFRYILVDEYQDTNPSQNDLVIMLGKAHRNVCVVGDDDQSIYSFRGATVENILNFDRSFKEVQTIKLEQNYRSAKTILDAANAVIANNMSRKGKELWTNGESGDKITARCLYTQKEEADYICNEIERLHAFGKPLNEMAILYRMNSISNALESALNIHRIPYKVYGGLRFNERKEIKDILAYLSLISNNSDNVRLRRIINVPKRQIGDTTVDTLASVADEKGISMLEAAKLSPCIAPLARASSKLTAFYKLISELTEYSKTHKISETINEIIVKTCYDEMLMLDNEKDKIDNVHEFISTGVAYEQSTDEPTLEGFLSDMALVSDTDDYDEGLGSVSLMTVHSAKGLEFSTVFIAGFEQGIFPSQMAINEGGMEEERRLAYVAITRAKSKLYITYTQSRTLYGSTRPSLVSGFYSEIPAELVDVGQKPKRESFSYGESRQTAKPFASYSKPQIKDFASPSASKPQHKSLFKAGDKVKHKFFGSGKVISCEQMGSDALVEVAFDNGQIKKLMASFAKLEKE